MPIDTSIYSQVRAPQAQDPLEQYGKLLALKQALSQQQQQARMAPIQEREATAATEAAELRNRQTRTAMDEETAFKEAIGRGAKPLDLYRTSPKLAGPYLKSQLEQSANEIKLAKEKLGIVASALGAARNAPKEQQAGLYTQGRLGLIQSGIIKPEEMPEQFDPAYVEEKFTAAIDADKQVDNLHKQREMAQRVLENAPKTAKEWLDMVYREASAATSQADLDQTRQTLKGLGVPDSLLARVPSMWSETAMKDLANRSMTPEQRATNADRDASRTQAAEEGRLNREVTIRGQNITRQGQLLNDSRQRELADLARQAAADARENKPPTEAQRTVASYAARIEDTEKTFAAIPQVGLWQKKAPNFLRSKEGQQFDQASRNFINAVLRRESGAAISASEFENAYAQYIPQWSDTPELLEQKARNRAIVMGSFKSAAGKAYESPEDLIKRAGTQPPATPKNPYR